MSLCVNVQYTGNTVYHLAGGAAVIATVPFNQALKTRTANVFTSACTFNCCVGQPVFQCQTRHQDVSHKKHIEIKTWTLCLCYVHLVVGVLDDSVQSRYQRLLQMQAAGIAGDAGFW